MQCFLQVCLPITFVFYFMFRNLRKRLSSFCLSCMEQFILFTDQLHYTSTLNLWKCIHKYETDHYLFHWHGSETSDCVSDNENLKKREFAFYQMYNILVPSVFRIAMYLYNTRKYFYVIWNAIPQNVLKFWCTLKTPSTNEQIKKLRNL